jgi:uncharacterized SAM-dependent methyltransferase
MTVRLPALPRARTRGRGFSVFEEVHQRTGVRRRALRSPSVPVRGLGSTWERLLGEEVLTETGARFPVPGIRTALEAAGSVAVAWTQERGDFCGTLAHRQ